MHQHSFDSMAQFRREHLEARRSEPLVIVDVGSQDFSGSYRKLFAFSPWRYIGVDLAAGQNVDLVLRDPYHWRELRSESADVVVCGQTFEHTEFFWETMLEIARILKPRALCCIIAPSSGPEHRYPRDCWRFFPDGFSAVARYAGLEIVEVRTQWENLPEYDFESNKWHDSILIARKPVQPFPAKFRQSVRTWLNRLLRPSVPRLETIIQIFYAKNGAYREEDSVNSRVDHDGWKNIAIALPSSAGAATPLRIDFSTIASVLDIAELRIIRAGQIYFQANKAPDFDKIDIRGDSERLPHPRFFRLKITGIDPQLYLPPISSSAGNWMVEMRLRVHAGIPGD
jgi:SAM-dependent methyltransferase